MAPQTVRQIFGSSQTCAERAPIPLIVQCLCVRHCSSSPTSSPSHYSHKAFFKPMSADCIPTVNWCHGRPRLFR